jgi:RNA polymerase sigma-70 factor (ECF subfamily)
MSTAPQPFTELIEPHLVALRRTAYRLCRSVSDAEDLVQDVCVRAMESWGEGRNPERPLAWMLRVQYNLYVDTVRKAAKVVAEPIDAVQDERAIADPRGGPELDAETSLTIDALDRVWPELTSDQQALLALYAEGHTLNELTEITELPLSALKARLHRARVRLGKLLQVAVRPDRTAASGENG